MNNTSQRSFVYVILSVVTVISLLCLAITRAEYLQLERNQAALLQANADLRAQVQGLGGTPVTPTTPVVPTAPSTTTQANCDQTPQAYAAALKQKQDAVLKRLDSRLSATVAAADLLAFQNETAMIPTCHYLLYTLPLHGSADQISVYDVSGITAIFRIDSKSKQGTMIGRFTPVSYTASSGADWYPVALTKDDRSVIMYAAMQSPGAGGGNVSYGYALLPNKAVTNSDMNLWKTRTEAPIITSDKAAAADQNDQALFFDDYGKVVFLTQGSKTPQCDQPCPLNMAKLVWKDLVANKTVTVLEEPDTTYKLGSINEVNNALSLTATTYKFSGSCVDLFCASSKKDSTRTIRLPN